MIPLPVILAELVMALGGALLGANVLALVRPRQGSGPGGQQVQARGRVVANMLIGLVVFAWGLASFLSRL